MTARQSFHNCTSLSTTNIMVYEVILSDSEKETNRSMETHTPNLNQSCFSCRRHSTGGEIKDKKIVRRLRNCKSVDKFEVQCSDGSFDKNNKCLTSVKTKLSGKTKLTVRNII